MSGDSTVAKPKGMLAGALAGGAGAGAGAGTGDSGQGGGGGGGGGAQKTNRYTLDGIICLMLGGSVVSAPMGAQ